MPVTEDVLLRHLRSTTVERRRYGVAEATRVAESSATLVHALQRLAADDPVADVRQAASAALREPAHQPWLNTQAGHSPAPPDHAPPKPADTPLASPEPNRWIKQTANSYYLGAFVSLAFGLMLLWIAAAGNSPAWTLGALLISLMLAAGGFVTVRLLDQRRRFGLYVMLGMNVIGMLVSLWVGPPGMWGGIIGSVYYMIVTINHWRQGMFDDFL